MIGARSRDARRQGRNLNQQIAQVRAGSTIHIAVHDKSGGPVWFIGL